MMIKNYNVIIHCIFRLTAIVFIAYCTDALSSESERNILIEKIIQDFSVTTDKITHIIIRNIINDLIVTTPSQIDHEKIERLQKYRTIQDCIKFYNKKNEQTSPLEIKKILKTMRNIFHFDKIVHIFNQNKVKIKEELLSYYKNIWNITHKWDEILNSPPQYEQEPSHYEQPQPKQSKTIVFSIKNYYPSYSHKNPSDNLKKQHDFLQLDPSTLGFMGAPVSSEPDISGRLFKDSGLFRKFYNKKDKEDLITVCNDKVFEFIIQYLTEKDSRYNIIMNFIEQCKLQINDLIYFSGVMKNFQFKHGKDYERVYKAIIKNEHFTYAYVNKILNSASPKKGEYDKNNVIKWALERIQTDLLNTLFDKLNWNTGGFSLKDLIRRYPNFKILFDTRHWDDTDKNRGLYQVLHDPQPYTFDWIFEKTKSLQSFVARNIQSIGIILGLSAAGITAYKAYRESKQGLTERHINNAYQTDARIHSFNQSKPLFKQRSFF